MNKLSNVIVGFCAAIGTSGVSAQAQEVTLRVHSFMHATSYQQLDFIEPWCAKVKVESNGKIACQIFPSMQLGGSPAELLAQLNDGIADVVFANPGYAPGKYLMSEVFELPFMVQDISQGAKAMWDFLELYGKNELPGVKIIATTPADYTLIQTIKKPIHTMEDLKGVKLRSSSRYASKTLEALGALPVQLPGGQITESMIRGIIDGGFLPWSAVRLLSLTEITKHYADFSDSQTKISNASQLFGMRQATYDEMSDELKAVIDANSGFGPSLDFANVYRTKMNEDREIVAAGDAEIFVLSDAEYQRWVDATSGVEVDWIADANAKGLDGKMLLAEAKRLLEKYKP